MSLSVYTVACIQTSSGPDRQTNIEQACALIGEARKSGADLVVLPEGVNFVDRDATILAQEAVEETEDPSLNAFSALAADLNIWLLVGSLGVRHSAVAEQRREPKFANRSLLIGNDGGVRERYTQIHPVDAVVGLGDRGPGLAAYDAGHAAVLADTPWGHLGMSVGYDLRFPHLYRQLAQAGAKYLAVPSATERQSGKAHWHVLLRARAIENGCFVFAAAQCGKHGNGRASYGHSLIVDPWGEVLADGGQEIGFVLAEVDPERVASARRKIPSLSQDRAYSGP